MESCSLEELASKISALRSHVEPPPAKVPVPPLPPVESPKRDAYQEENDNAWRWEQWNSLVTKRGERYRDCRLGNFHIQPDSYHAPLQTKVIQKLTHYCENIREHIREGHGVVLFGPRGTGKDHLAMAICRSAIGALLRVRWENGMDLFGNVRDSMDERRGTSEAELVRLMASPDLLYLSDPLPPYGDLSPFQASILFRILDARYSRKKPVLCTINALGSAEMDSRMGSQNVDRLRDGSVAIFCNWESNRRTIEP